MNIKELPKIKFSDNAITVLERRYLSKDSEGNILETPEERLWSMCLAVAQAEKGQCKELTSLLKRNQEPPQSDDGGSLEPVIIVRDHEREHKCSVQGWAERFYNELIVPLKFLPNSPTIVNAGKKGVVGSLQACVVISPEDNLDSIYNTIHDWALTEKYGAGIGGYFGDIREKGSPINTTHGQALGPIAIMKILSESSKWITQGVFREGAHMAVLPIDHPDILEFIHCKDNCKGPNDILFNFNISVSITDQFMHCVEDDDVWYFVSRAHKSINDRDAGHIRAKDLWEEICNSAWLTGDPGVIFIDRIRETEPNPHLGKIVSTNPCGEEPLENYGSCNLGSINLSKFVLENIVGTDTTWKLSEMNWDSLKETIDLAVRFLDNVITINDFPKEVPQLKEMNLNTRRIGLGVMGWHDLLVKLNISYVSEEATKLAKDLSCFISKYAWEASERLGKEKGNFPEFKFSRVSELYNLAYARNSNVTTIAPTGTISIFADCSSGIEPYFSLATERKALWSKGEQGVTLIEVPRPLQDILDNNCYDLSDFPKDKLNNINIRKLINDKYSLFLTTHEIEFKWHIKHLSAWQENITNGVSKTINLLNEATIDDVRNSYELAWNLKCKAVTIFRDGSKDIQILNEIGKDKDIDIDKIKKEVIDFSESSRIPAKRPDTLIGVTHKINTGHGKIYVTVNSDKDKPFEVFINAGKSGSCDDAQGQAITRLISLALRSGIEVNEVVDQLRGISCCPIWHQGSQILSQPDAISYVLSQYLDDKELGEQLQVKYEEVIPGSKRVAPKCAECGQPVIFRNGCKECQSCGWSKCD